MDLQQRSRSALRCGALALTLLVGLLGVTPSAGPVVAAPAGSGLLVTGVQTEASSEPLGLDAANPRLSWRLESQRRGVLQSAYRVRVSSTAKLAASGKADVWDTGRVTSGRPWVDYQGPHLSPRTRYFWTVDVWDERGVLSAAPPPGWFETAFTDPSQWTADWISGSQAPAGCAEQRLCSPAPLLRTEFTVAAPIASARLYASGLGYGTYYLNGTRVDDAVLSPGFTDYTERALYITSDVTSMLKEGQNALGAVLGRGPFGTVGYNYAGYASAPWHADPQLRLELHVRYRDGRKLVVRSGPGWTTTDGPTRFDDYMLGETYDARRADELAGWATAGFDDATWAPARSAPGPQGRLEAQVEEPVRPQATIPFTSVSQTTSGSYLFDLGQDVTGNAILRTDVPIGSTITLHYGEKLDSSGSVDTSGGSFDGSTMQLDTYIGGPGEDVWRPEFTFKGFRYVEVSGLDSPPSPPMLTAEVWHTDFPAIGAWTSSNNLANRIYAASRRSIVSNSLSIPMDTPIYEKTGYTADGQVVAGAASYLFDTRRFYQKWLTDIRQSVAPNGDMGISAPLPSDPADPQAPTGFAYTSPGWDAALFVVPDVLKRFHDDVRPGVAALPEMKRMRAYYDTQTQGDILPATCTVATVQVCPNGLGDWAAPAGMSYGAALDSTAWYLWMLHQLADVARDANDVEAEASAEARSAQVARAFDATFFDPILRRYRDPLNPQPGELTRAGVPSAYSQHQNALPLGLGLVPADRRTAVGASLAADIRDRDNHLSTGIMGTRFLFDALTRTGHVDEAFSVLTQTSYPSYGYWLDGLGYTGLGEYWEAGQRSHNHQMFGSVVQWLFEDLAGIRPTEPGFAEIEIRPEIPSTGLDHVAAHTDTDRGRVATEWWLTKSGFELSVTVPANTEAVVYVPADAAAWVFETGSGQSLPAASAPGVTLVGQQPGRVVYRIGSGDYHFRSQSVSP